jgi:hypothetical protein
VLVHPGCLEQLLLQQQQQQQLQHRLQ